MKDNLLIERQNLGLKKETVAVYCAGSVLMPNSVVGIALNNTDENGNVMISVGRQGVFSVAGDSIRTGDIITSKHFAETAMCCSGLA